MLARPTICQVIQILKPQIGTAFHVPKTANKGSAGLFLEQVTGIPQSSACLDCEDGEVKAYPLKKLIRKGKLGIAGDYVPKETVAITMMVPNKMATEPWADTRVCNKIKNVLFVAYERNGDSVIFKYLQVLRQEDQEDLFAQFEQDYNEIKEIFIATDIITSRTGTLIQSRTKGPGKNAPKTRAYYFRPALMHQLPQI